jgi:hypothetical protein
MPLTIALVAFAVRLALLFGTGLYHNISNYEANNVARAIAAGQGIANPYSCITGATGHLAPLFPLFSAGLLAATGSYWGLAKALASIATVSLIWAAMPYVSRELGFSRTAGVLAGFVGAFLPLSISTELRGDWEAPYIAAGLMFMAVRAIRLAKMPALTIGKGARDGICWGGLLLILPGAILLLPGWLWRICRDRGRVCAQYAPVLVAATGLIVFPYIVYSRAHVGHWFFIRDNLGLELFVSNHPDAALLMIDNMEKAMARYHPLLNKDACAEIQRLGEGEFEKRRLHEAIGFIKADPATFLKRSAQRAIWLLFPWTADRRRDVIEWTVSLAGLVGCVLAIRLRHPTIWFLISGVVLYSLPYLLVQTSPRYRYPVWWVFVMLGLYAVRQIARQLRRAHFSNE